MSKKLQLVTQEHKSFFIPLNSINVEVYEVLAKNQHHAVERLKESPNSWKVVKRISLKEKSSTIALEDPSDMHVHEYLERQIDEYDIFDRDVFDMGIMK
jgi:hypothetical protein